MYNALHRNLQNSLLIKQYYLIYWCTIFYCRFHSQPSVYVLSKSLHVNGPFIAKHLARYMICVLKRQISRSILCYFNFISLKYYITKYLFMRRVIFVYFEGSRARASSHTQILRNLTTSKTILKKCTSKPEKI